METLKNNTNSAEKRTAPQVNAILRANGVKVKAENMGDGRLFSITNITFADKVNIKRAGFILGRSNEGDRTIYFRTW